MLRMHQWRPLMITRLLAVVLLAIAGVGHAELNITVEPVKDEPVLVARSSFTSTLEEFTRVCWNVSSLPSTGRCEEAKRCPQDVCSTEQRFKDIPPGVFTMYAHVDTRDSVFLPWTSVYKAVTEAFMPANLLNITIQGPEFVALGESVAYNVQVQPSLDALGELYCNWQIGDKEYENQPPQLEHAFTENGNFTVVVYANNVISAANGLKNVQVLEPVTHVHVNTNTTVPYEREPVQLSVTFLGEKRPKILFMWNEKVLQDSYSNTLVQHWEKSGKKNVTVVVYNAVSEETNYVTINVKHHSSSRSNNIAIGVSVSVVAVAVCLLLGLLFYRYAKGRQRTVEYANFAFVGNSGTPRRRGSTAANVRYGALDESTYHEL